MRRWLLPTLVTACGCTTDGESASTDAWAGRWTGPEGTYLAIAGAAGVYEITVKDLDAARTFPGVAADGGIEFERDGTTELLKHTNGDDTGMKWLAGKTNCLTVRPGEGYCRD
jgi:hypothetical protein